MAYQESLQRIVGEVIEPGAADVDRTGAFPRKQIDALAEAGLLALTVPEELGGGGLGLRAAADVVRAVGAACGSTAMITTMHYSGTAALLAADRKPLLQEIAAGRHLTTLAFSEAGSRSHFWAPMSTAIAEADEVRLDAEKSWVTSAGEADSYIWSSRPLSESAKGPMTLWYVAAASAGLSDPSPFDGLGLRGNASSPLTADGVQIPRASMLSEDGLGLDLALAAVLPVFLVLNAAGSVGLMSSLATEAAEHLQSSQLRHLGQSLAEQAGPRGQLAQLRIRYDQTRALLNDTLTAVEQGRDDAQLLVLEIKAAAGEAAADAADLALRIGGGAAFRKESAIERRFRDSRAARVMAPTTEALHDFVGRALLGLPLLDGPE